MKNPCWSGYEMYGFKEKNGKRVPNCVPKKNSDINRMPLFLELGSSGHNFPKGKAIVVDTKGHHYSRDPIPRAKAEAQMRAINASKKGMVK